MIPDIKAYDKASILAEKGGITMLTIGHKNWAVNLSDVRAMQPIQGWEGLTTIIGVIFWLGWH